MGTFVFKWPHPANEVFVTGTFDDWAKSVQLEKKGDIFEKEVTLPKDEKALYKFVVDGTWIHDHAAPIEDDGHNNVNNVIFPHDIKKEVPGAAILSSAAPTSTTAGLAGEVPKKSEGPGSATISSAAPDSSTTEMAKDVPLEKAHTGSSALPGSFPETPAGEPETFSVNPIPATEGIGNPVHLAPGEKVPDPSTLTSNTVQSTATTDKESFEKGGENVPATMSKDEGDSGAFSVPPVSKNMIPESSLPMGEGETKGLETDTGPTIQSAAPDSTTAGLAGAVPKEPRGQATTVDDTPASTNGESRKEEAGIVAGAGAAVAAGGAAVASAVGSKKEEEPSTSIAPDVPETVRESILESKTSPEAAGNEEAVIEKKEMEAQLQKEVTVDETRRVPEDPPSAQPIITEDGAADGKLKAPEEPKARHQSRDLSPHSKPAAPPAGAEAPAPAKTTNAPAPGWSPGSAPTSATSTPAKSAEETPAKDKKKKRASGFWGKIKDKLK